MLERSSDWKIRLFGSFRVVSPTGQPVEFRNQKVEALLAVLCYHAPLAVRRIELGEILWPEKTERARLDNLKQSLSILRRFLGPDAIESTPQQICLSDSISFDSDLTSHESGKLFMPLQAGEWFSAVRLEFLAQEEPPEESPTDSLYRTVLWLAKYKPRAAYDLMRDGFYLALGMTSRQLREVVRQCGRIPGYEQWHDLWLGYGFGHGSLSRQVATLRSALHHANVNGDKDVTTWASYTLGMHHARKGDVSVAVQYATALREQPGVSRRAALLMEGNIAQLVDHSDHAAELIARFDDGVQEAEYASVRAASSALRHAIMGKISTAQNYLALHGSPSLESGHRLGTPIAITAQAVMHVSTGNRDLGIQLLRQVASITEELPDYLPLIQAKEALAVLLKQDGEIRSAQSLWHEAYQARHRHQVTYSPWDQRFYSVVRHG